MSLEQSVCKLLVAPSPIKADGDAAKALSVLSFTDGAARARGPGTYPAPARTE